MVIIESFIEATFSPQQAHILPEGSDTSGKANDEHNETDQEEKEANVEDDIEYCAQFECLSAGPFVHYCINPNLKTFEV